MFIVSYDCCHSIHNNCVRKAIQPQINDQDGLKELPTGIDTTKNE